LGLLDPDVTARLGAAVARQARIGPGADQTATGAIRIGISGWLYPPWRGSFYPKGLPAAQELSFAASHFRSIELNGSFYRLQRPEHFQRWHELTPEDFVFAVKGSRFITHMLKLRNIRAALANFFASGVLRLGRKLGPLLWQFPAQLGFEPGRLQAFLELLPRDTDQARALARDHDARVAGRAYLRADFAQPLRHAVEIRHPSFCTPAFIELLRRYDTALVCADTVEWPLRMDLTSDFVYCRLHGSEELYVSGYDERALERWAARVRTWARGREPRDARRIAARTPPLPGGRDVFVYFDNTVKDSAPLNALALAKRLGVSPTGERPLRGRMSADVLRANYAAAVTRRKASAGPLHSNNSG
jgi:uncharacterized protein YecE (DUF72 family)